EKIATPPVRCGATVTLVCGATCCLTEPVIETLVGQIARPRRQPGEEPVGFEVVSQVIGLFTRATSAIHQGSWVVPAEVGDLSRSGGGQRVYGRVEDCALPALPWPAVDE